jgi:hypothetical protein
MRLLKKIPIGSFLNVRFDIDFSSNVGDCNNPFNSLISELFISSFHIPTGLYWKTFYTQIPNETTLSYTLYNNNNPFTGYSSSDLNNETFGTFTELSQGPPISYTCPSNF